MRRFEIFFMIVSVLSVSAYADSEKPLCEGNQVAPALQGNYETAGEGGVTLLIKIAPHEIVVNAPGGIQNTTLAWSCTKDGRLILVNRFVDEQLNLTYDSSVVQLDGDLLRFAEVDPGETLTDELINERFARSSSTLRRQRN